MAAFNDPEALKQWFNDVVSHGQQKVTNLHFYMHDIVVSESPTAVKIAEADSTANSAFMFGRTVAMDDPLTVGPERDSEVIGRAQGMYSSASHTELAYMLVVNMVFTAGEFKGSSLALLCSDSVFRESRELSIVGGTGAFKLARGVAIAKTHSNTEIFNAVEEYNVCVLHYY